MSGVLGRVARLFLEEPVVADDGAGAPAAPAAPAPAAVAWLPPVASAEPVAVRVEPRAGRPGLAVVCEPRDARIGGAAAGLALAGARRSGCAVVLTWSVAARGAAERPAIPAARRLAADLRRRGHAVCAAGRIVHVALPLDEEEAAAVIELLAWEDAPVAVVIAGPRGAALETVLQGCPAIVVLRRAGADDELSAMAAADLERLGPPVLALELAASPLAGVLARCGLHLPPALRARLTSAIGAAG